MGRYYVRLDPTGYYRPAEPGFDFELTGAEWLQQLAPTQEHVPVNSELAGFYSPPGFPFVMCRPRQFGKDWVRDARLSQHVLLKSDWTFMSGLTANGFEQSAVPGGTPIAANEWTNIPRVPSGTGLLPINFTNLAAATNAGFNLTGFKVVAVAGLTPLGGPMRGAYHPHFQWNAWPEPAKPIVFGWSNLALILFRHGSYLLRNAASDGVTWQLLSRVESGGKDAVNVLGFQGRNRSQMFMPVGTHNACLFTDGGSDSLRVRVADDDTVDVFPSTSGGWWIGSAEGERLTFQAQVVGYENADSTTATSPPIMFSLGNYRPSVAPSLQVNRGLWILPGGSVTAVVNGDGSHTYASADMGQTIVAGIRDSTNTAWVSNGVRNSGAFHLTMVPGNADANGAYLSPNVRHIALQFPVVLTPRDATPLTLDDTQWRTFTFTKSLREPLGAQIAVELFDNATEILADAGFDERLDFPIELWEDVDDDGTPDVLRVAGWVSTPDLNLIQPIGTVRPGGAVLSAQIQEYQIFGKGILSLMDERWLFLPQMTNPLTPGYVEHTYALARSLLQSGIDTSDTDRVEFATDIWAGTDVARLPGTWAYQKGQMDTKVESVWAPDWDETRWDYARKIAREWSGWNFYERLDGKVWYHPDPAWELAAYTTGKYYESGTIYKDNAAALAASRAFQVWAPEAARSIEPPEANTVRFSGAAVDGQPIPHVIDQWVPSVSDPDDEDYLGREKHLALVSQFGVSKLALGKLARLALHRVRRKHLTRTWVMPTLAPWDTLPDPMDLGTVWTLAGVNGAYLITHIQGQVLSSRVTTVDQRSKVRTTVTGERLPATAVSGTEGAYPGIGV